MSPRVAEQSKGPLRNYGFVAINPLCVGHLPGFRGISAGANLSRRLEARPPRPAAELDSFPSRHSVGAARGLPDERSSAGCDTRSRNSAFAEAHSASPGAWG